jgi:O-antigen ligase
MRVRATLLALCVAGYPLAAAIQAVTGLSSRLVTVPYRALVAGLSIWVLVRAWKAGWSGYGGMLWLPLAVFWLLYAWRLAMDGLFLPVAFGDPFSDYLLLGLGASLLPMLACFTIVDADAAARARTLTIAMATCGAVAAVILGFRDIALGNFLSVITGRLGLEALNPISLGHLGVTTSLLWMDRLLSPSGSRYRVLGIAAVLAGIAVAVISGSRGPILALIVCSAAMLLVARHRGRSVLGVVLVAVAVVTGVQGARIAGDQLGLGVIQRVGGWGEDRSSLDRVTILRDSWDQFLAHPLLGSGLQEKVSGSYPHNPALEAFMATGVVGGATFFLLLVAGTLAALRLVRAAGDGAWLGILLLQYLLGAMLSGAVYAGTTLYPLLAAGVALASTLPRTTWAGFVLSRPQEAGG